MMSDRDELAYRFAHQAETREAAIDELVEAIERGETRCTCSTSRVDLFCVVHGLESDEVGLTPSYRRKSYFDSPDRSNENACVGCGRFVAVPDQDGRCDECGTRAHGYRQGE